MQTDGLYKSILFIENKYSAKVFFIRYQKILYLLFPDYPPAASTLFAHNDLFAAFSGKSFRSPIPNMPQFNLIIVKDDYGFFLFIDNSPLDNKSGYIWITILTTCTNLFTLQYYKQKYNFFIFIFSNILPLTEKNSSRKRN